MKTIKSVAFALAPALVLAVAAAVAQGQELKIGYINSERIMRESMPAKAALAKLETELRNREKELNDSATKLKNAADRLEKDAITLTETERSRRQRDLADQDRELQRKRREFQEDLSQRRNEALAEIVGRANIIIKQIHETEKYDLILQEAVMVSPRMDITEKVIKALNAQSGAK